MSKKNVTFRQDMESNSQPISCLPQTLRFKNLTNHGEGADISSLKSRISELQMKVSQLQARIKSKRKRIRRKSSQVQKRHNCQFCKKLYGSLVSLNLHQRLKHRKQKQQKELLRQGQLKQEANMQQGSQ